MKSRRGLKALEPSGVPLCAGQRGRRPPCAQQRANHSLPLKLALRLRFLQQAPLTSHRVDSGYRRYGGRAAEILALCLSDRALWQAALSGKGQGPRSGLGAPIAEPDHAGVPAPLAARTQCCSATFNAVPRRRAVRLKSGRSPPARRGGFESVLEGLLEALNIVQRPYSLCHRNKATVTLAVRDFRLG
jgi:hypothetical protein